MKNIIFFKLHFLESGTSVATYDYAYYNEVLLNNKSFIVTFSDKTKEEYGCPTSKICYEKFKSRFPIFEIDTIEDITQIIKDYNIDFTYILTHGVNTDKDTFKFGDKSIWLNCKTIKHAVYNTTTPNGDIFCCITDSTNKKFNTSCPILPHMISLPTIDTDLRHDLNIPKDAKVFGYYGGVLGFNILQVIDTVNNIAKKYSNIYFLFMNVDQRPFSNCTNIIHLPTNISNEYKVKFINTCDALIHARLEGETFGLTIGEFASKGKNVISYRTHFEYDQSTPYINAHFDILKDKIIQYKNNYEFEHIILNFDTIKKDMSNNGYMLYTPEYVMNIFQSLLK